ncbi:MAG: 4Fe-4S cluster-binding domain-containing protein [Bacteroidetes bacterium]|nr:4Fe-4S cluster-binding domain-containing protein [Bacteroidota bacterium]
MIEFNPLTEIPVMEHFYSLQGEGFHQGSAAYFIRLAGCDVGCHWCDVKESWQAEKSQLVSIESLVAALDNNPKSICVITGGEPAMYNLGPLTTQLRNAGWKVHIETSGAYPVSGFFDWVCVSPKKIKDPQANWLSIADEIKVIVFNKNDLDWADEFIDKVQPDCELYLQPEWSKEKLVLPLIVDKIKCNPKWKISLQSHKYMGIE